MNPILVVDDNVFNIMTLQAIIESKYGLQSDKAVNGKEAVDIVTARSSTQSACSLHAQYSLIFMDCNMPIMDGFEATKEIKKVCT